MYSYNDDDEVKGVVTEESAADVAADPYSDLTLWQAVKKWRRVVLYCVCLASTITM